MGCKIKSHKHGYWLCPLAPDRGAATTITKTLGEQYAQKNVA